jgi:pathogenesis-related protein 1
VLREQRNVKRELGTPFTNIENMQQKQSLRSFFRICAGCFVALAALATPVTAQALTPAEQSAMVAAHNQWRKADGVADVRWSDALAATSRQWADQLKDNNACRMKHSAAKGYGENLYWASARRWSDGRVELQNITPARVVNTWGEEKKDYDYAANTCAPGKQCGHYTQVVWKSTTEVGCARAVCADQSQVWVCQYTPPGNWRGQKPF